MTFPGNGFLFDQADRQGVSYFNYGEGLADVYPQVPDRDRTPAQLAQAKRVYAKSDVGPGFTAGGCYPSDVSIGTAVDNGEIFDSSLPAGAPAGSYSHIDCFRQRFVAQLAAGNVPAFNYLSLTSDHTRGTQVGFPTPTAMVADSDLALGELVDTVSHSPIWSSSAIFVVEDDSQDGADHADAHRIPVAVIGPYARSGVVVNTRYDLLSAVRTMELILGLQPLGLNDALATPMYDAFSPTPDNAAGFSAIRPGIDLLTRNTAASPLSVASSQLNLGQPDQVTQEDLDRILWQSVHGADSQPPPPGPNASPGE